MGKRIEQIKQIVNIKDGKTIEALLKKQIQLGIPLGKVTLHSPPQPLPRHSPPMLNIPIEFSEDVHDASGKVVGTQTGFLPRLGTGMKHTQKRKEKVLYQECLIEKEGYTRQITEEAHTNVEARQKINTEIQRQKDIEEKIRQNEQDRFPNRFLALCRYLNVQSYNDLLVKKAENATIKDLEEAQQRIVNGEKRTLSEEQKNTSLNWLAYQITLKRNNKTT